MAFTVQDHYFLKAKKQHYLARAIYKLEEIQKRYKIMKAGDRILDLGAAPGSWIQLASGVVGRSGLVVGIDLKAIEHSFPNHVVTLQGDIFEREFVETALRDYLPFDVVLSDMAPATSGIKQADTARSALFFERAFEIARWALRPAGDFSGQDISWLGVPPVARGGRKNNSARPGSYRPEATRKQSREIYILAMKLKGE